MDGVGEDVPEGCCDIKVEATSGKRSKENKVLEIGFNEFSIVDDGNVPASKRDWGTPFFCRD